MYMTVKSNDSCTHFILILGNGSVSEKLLKLQGSLLSVKHNYESSEIKEDSQMTFQSVIDHSLNETYFVAWASRNAKCDAMMRNERLLQDKEILVQDVTKLQRKGNFFTKFGRNNIVIHDTIDRDIFIGKIFCL